ncbi:hypothetical protein SAMN05444008_105164 [Cnuella takakiae]|uniref:General stress protein 17M-like domain-containing protein n=1 Tax=Cnuella takakiae TaxID=1302690 RepID=A0A1M4ZBP8_9BACT|nr:hypothetical protein [Cnuella takakiae]OLY94261.1 hypothetical protein BUE76_22020 [Cnuella takakiae]SHF15460.1 hypothetical protein SAMN05444008_105164 [Cnuella takakiae]
MAQTVIGFFKDPADAHKAVECLNEKGISQQFVDVSKGEYLDGTADSEGRNTNKFTDLFNKLFGHDSDDAKRYSTIVQTNVTLVTVHASSNDLAEAASDILDDCGAIDVDEHGSGNEAISQEDSTFGATGSDHLTLAGSSTAGSGGIKRRSRIVDQYLDENSRLRM